MTRASRLLLLPILVCLLAAVPGSAAAATLGFPSISKVSPATLGVGDTLVLRGKEFRAGKGRNTVVFKRDGGRAVFVKAGKATRTSISVQIPAKLLGALGQKAGAPVPTRFRVRVLASRFGKRFTSAQSSPVIGPTSTAPEKKIDDCDGDLIPDGKDPDNDNDLLSNALELTLKTDACKRDSDGDGMSDGWEHESALDYNGRALPNPSRRPYPNALNAEDGKLDSDGDGLTNVLEYAAWATYGQNRTPLNYSGGNPASTGKQGLIAAAEWWDRDKNGFLSDNERDADDDGLPNQDEGGVGPLPVQENVVGFFANEYLELSKVKDVISFVPLFGPLDYVRKVEPTDWLERDSDGDRVLDGTDDQDGDGLSNVSEVVRELATPIAQREQLPINACAPSLDARLCIVGDDDIDNDGRTNRVDDDDDGDRLVDPVERQYGLNPFKADTDGDAVTDGYEYQSAIDLNSTAVPFPGKRPYPNPLDGKDGAEDYDGDGLTLTEEFAAWRYTGSPSPLSYSDGSLYTGGRGAEVGAGDVRDTDRSRYLSDDERDVDGDELGNWDEAHGRMTPSWWKATYAEATPPESPYPGRSFLATNFVDPDTDGDTIPDGADDEDHDGFTNVVEMRRPADWFKTYVSTAQLDGTNPRARTNPFNPCKPFYSSTCHRYPPFDYYEDGEDWESPVRQDGP